MHVETVQGPRWRTVVEPQDGVAVMTALRHDSGGLCDQSQSVGVVLEELKAEMTQSSKMAPGKTESADARAGYTKEATDVHCKVPLG